MGTPPQGLCLPSSALLHSTICFLKTEASCKACPVPCHLQRNLPSSFPSLCPLESSSPGFLCALGKLPGGSQPIKQDLESGSRMFPCSHGTKGRAEHTKKFLLCLEGSPEEEMRGSGEPPHCSRALAGPQVLTGWAGPAHQHLQGPSSASNYGLSPWQGRGCILG